MREGTKTTDQLSQPEEGYVNDTADRDLQYVTMAIRGEPQAFEMLVRRHQKRMFNIAYRMTGNYDDAADIVQESFLSAYKAIRKFRGDARFSTWLYGIVVNHSRNRIRAANTRSFHEPLSLDEDLSRVDGHILHFDPPSPDVPVVDALVRKETQEKVQKCINQLDKDHREILVLRDIQGFSYEEIIEMLGVPEGTVKSRLSRARSAIKDILNKTFGDL
ncbi:MAG: sigma-70 family RNA polymerase sigma factor [Syntrophorhabdus sp.]